LGLPVDTFIPIGVMIYTFDISQVQYADSGFEPAVNTIGIYYGMVQNNQFRRGKVF